MNIRGCRLAVGAVLGLLSLWLTGCGEQSTQTDVAMAPSEPVPLKVYKSPDCGCCGLWVDHMEEGNFAATVDHQTNLNAVKRDLGIEPMYQSCHTAVTDDERYFFEGHIPGKIVQRFLSEAPADVLGLAVPSMPLGSPGMEVDDRFTAYKVYQLNRDGSWEVYDEVTSQQEQYWN